MLENVALCVVLKVDYYGMYTVVQTVECVYSMANSLSVYTFKITNIQQKFISITNTMHENIVLVFYLFIL